MSVSPEHTFAEEVLVSGENIDSYTAGEAINQREPVGISGDLEVSLSGDDGNFIGVAAYDVANGEEVAVIKRDCEVKISVNEAITAGDELVPNGVGGFRQAVDADGEVGVAIASEDIASGEIGQAEIVTGQGVRA
jgi:hypothetical protein